MLWGSLAVGLVYVPFVVLGAAGRTGRDNHTYQCSGNGLHHILPRLDEASIDHLNALQGSGIISSVDLVHVRYMVGLASGRVLTS